MGDLHSIRRAVVTLGVAIMLVIAGGGAARAAAWHWSQPLHTDNTQGQSLSNLQCPSAVECVTLSASNQLVGFAPDQAVSPGTVVTPEAPGQVLMGLSCPSVSQCETITADGELVRANLASGGGASTVQLQPATDQPVVDGLHAISCVSMTLCVVVTGAGQAISLDPSSPGSALTANLVSGQEFGLVALSCPSTTQCTAVGHSVAVTFDPTTLAVSGSGALAGSQSLVSQVDCPDTTECVASTSAGRALTFAPDSPGTAVATTLETGQLYPIEAPQLSQRQRLRRRLPGGPRDRLRPRRRGDLQPAGRRRRRRLSRRREVPADHRTDLPGGAVRGGDRRRPVRDV